jgi:hypothetical protein
MGAASIYQKTNTVQSPIAARFAGLAGTYHGNADDSRRAAVTDGVAGEARGRGLVSECGVCINRLMRGDVSIASTAEPAEGPHR